VLSVRISPAGSCCPPRTGVAGYTATPDNRGEDDRYLIERDLTTSHYEVIESSSNAG